MYDEVVKMEKALTIKQYASYLIKIHNYCCDNFDNPDIIDHERNTQLNEMFENYDYLQKILLMHQCFNLPIELRHRILKDLLYFSETIPTENR